jgi:hypothetical protein
MMTPESFQDLYSENEVKEPKIVTNQNQGRIRGIALLDLFLVTNIVLLTI